jgi:hypothetical protein
MWRRSRSRVTSASPYEIGGPDWVRDSFLPQTSTFNLLEATCSKKMTFAEKRTILLAAMSSQVFDEDLIR